MEIPIQAVSPSSLSAETPLKYDEICRLIGNLYLESYIRVSGLESHFKSLMQQYHETNMQLSQETLMLKQALEAANAK